MEYIKHDPGAILAEALQNKQPAALATMIAVKGASPAKAGARITLLADGTTVDTVGSGKLEKKLLR